MKETARPSILPPGYLEHGAAAKKKGPLPSGLETFLRGKRTYTVHGAVFSSEEYAEAQTLLIRLADFLRQNNALGTDYASYAKMGLGEVILWEMVQHFSQPQIQAILTDYRQSLHQLVSHRFQQLRKGQLSDQEPCSPYYLAQWENGHCVPYPTVAWDRDRIEKIYAAFAAGRFRSGREVYIDLVCPALSSVSGDQWAGARRLIDDLTDIELFRDRLEEFSCQFFQPLEPWEEL